MKLVLKSPDAPRYAAVAEGHINIFVTKAKETRGNGTAQSSGNSTWCALLLRAIRIAGRSDAFRPKDPAPPNQTIQNDYEYNH